MVDLTVVILTKNEEKNLRKCIQSFNGIAKRFVIIDSYSTDSTEILCTQLNKELMAVGSSLDFYQHKWKNYADQLNWGLTNTNIDTEWSMRMDSDEELMEELALEIELELPNVTADTNGIVLRRRVYFMGRWIKHGGRYPELLLRIFRTGSAFCEKKMMDEHMILKHGSITAFKSDFIDNNNKNLDWWTSKHNWYSNREVLDYQMSLLSHKNSHNGNDLFGQAKLKRLAKSGFYYKLPMFWRAHLYFIYRYYLKFGFLDGPEGKIFNFLQAYWYRFLVDAKLYECEKKEILMRPQGDLKT